MKSLLGALSASVGERLLIFFIITSCTSSLTAPSARSHNISLRHSASRAQSLGEAKLRQSNAVTKSSFRTSSVDADIPEASLLVCAGRTLAERMNWKKASNSSAIRPEYVHKIRSWCNFTTVLWLCKRSSFNESIARRFSQYRLNLESWLFAASKVKSGFESPFFPFNFAIKLLSSGKGASTTDIEQHCWLVNLACTDKSFLYFFRQAVSLHTSSNAMEISCTELLAALNEVFEDSNGFPTSSLVSGSFCLPPISFPFPLELTTSPQPKCCLVKSCFLLEAPDVGFCLLRAEVTFNGFLSVSACSLLFFLRKSLFCFGLWVGQAPFLHCLQSTAILDDFIAGFLVSEVSSFWSVACSLTNFALRSSLSTSSSPFKNFSSFEEDCAVGFFSSGTSTSFFTVHGLSKDAIK